MIYKGFCVTIQTVENNDITLGGNNMDTITLTREERDHLLWMLDAEAVRIQTYKDVDPITQIENEEELKIINSICDRLEHTL